MIIPIPESYAELIIIPLILLFLFFLFPELFILIVILVFIIVAVFLVAKSSVNESPDLMMRAVVNNDLNKVKILLESGCDVNKIIYKPSGAFTTALILASTLGYTEIVQLLIRHNAIADMVDSHNRPAIFYAVSLGNTKIVKILFGHRANSNMKNGNKEPSLENEVDNESKNDFKNGELKPTSSFKNDPGTKVMRWYGLFCGIVIILVWIWSRFFN